ncbi:DUF4340 domain-containing protein [Puniceicoccaceae bacterium K14]|nr:DUF4340 domain-containing protein [Puniceicoccaceae bacterium K14]
MNIKNLYISAGVLFAISAIILLTGNPNSKTKTDDRIETKVITQESLSPLGSVNISSNDSDITLKLDQAENQWLLEERYSMPIDFSKLSNLINEITKVEVIRLATSNKDRLSDLGLEGNETLSFLDTKGDLIQTIEIGKNADNGRQIIRFGNEEKAYLVDTAIRLESTPLNWLSKELISIETDSLTEFNLSTVEGESLNLNRVDSESDWAEISPLAQTNRSIKQDAVESLLKQLETIRFTDLAEIDDEKVQTAKQYNRSFSFKQADGTAYSIVIGRKPEVVLGNGSDKEDSEPATEPAGPVFIKITSSEDGAPINQYMDKAAFEVSSYLFTNLVKSISDLTEEISIEEPKEDSTEEETEQPEGSTVE